MPRILYPQSWVKESRDALDAMFTRARAEGLWFFHGGLSGPLWFSPDELQTVQEKGSFIWGPENWRLRSPLERICEIDEKIQELQRERDHFVKGMR